MIQDLALALRLQALDRKIKHLELEISTLPKHIAEVEKKLEAHKRRLEINKIALTANQRDRKKLEADIQTNDQKISKLKAQMAEAKNNEQYRAFQNEISYCEGEIRKCEDKTIELMEQAEPLNSAVTTADGELREQQHHVNAEKKHAQERTAVDQTALHEAQSERKLIVSQMAPSFYTHYERIRKKTKGTVVADATEGRCDACQISLRPQFFQDLRRGDQIMFCESCGRILTYNPVVDLSSGSAAVNASK